MLEQYINLLDYYVKDLIDIDNFIIKFYDLFKHEINKDIYEILNNLFVMLKDYYRKSTKESSIKIHVRLALNKLLLELCLIEDHINVD